MSTLYETSMNKIAPKIKEVLEDYIITKVSAISERIYDEPWHTGIENIVWDILEIPSSKMTDEEAILLKAASDATNSWVLWDGKPVIVPISEWRKIQELQDSDVHGNWGRTGID